MHSVCVCVCVITAGLGHHMSGCSVSCHQTWQLCKVAALHCRLLSKSIASALHHALGLGLGLEKLVLSDCTQWSMANQIKQNSSFLVQLCGTVSFSPVSMTLNFATCTCRTTQAGLTNVLGALYATTLFFSIINATVIQPVIAAERAVSYRERAAGMYSVFPFTLALVSHSCIYRLSLAEAPTTFEGGLPTHYLCQTGCWMMC